MIKIWDETNNELLKTGINKDLLLSYEFIKLYLLLFYQNPINLSNFLTQTDSENETINNLLKFTYESMSRILDINMKYGENYLNDLITAELKFINVLLDDHENFDFNPNPRSSCKN